MSKSRRDATPNVALYNLRDAMGMTQQDVADAINALPLAIEKHVHVDNVTVSRWERGTIERPSPVHRRLLAQVFDVSLDELGFTRPRSLDTKNGGGDLDLDAFLTGHSPLSVEPRVIADQERWRTTRDQLNAHRAQLAAVAAELYEPEQRLDGAPLLTQPAWMPDQPIELGRVKLAFLDEAPAPEITGTEDRSRSVRPLATTASRYPHYSYALRDIGHPGLFENRLSYRLLDIRWTPRTGRMTFSHTTYYEAVDVNEAIAHETAQALLRESDNGTVIGRPTWRSLPFRKLIGNPFDLTRRPQLPSIDTLTIRQADDGATFVLHSRNAKQVAVAGDMLHVMPAGVFQPSSLHPEAQMEDFDLWRNIMREYSEEFLGNAEHGGDGAPVDYSQEPFRTMNDARKAGAINAWCLGLGLDPLTLFGEILTVVVIEADIYDALFAEMVDANDEGTVVNIGGRRAPTHAIPFDELTVPRLIEHDALSPAAAACLSLAWQHRDVLLR